MIHLGNHLDPCHGSLMLLSSNAGKLRDETAQDESRKAFRE
jgi:hypothetical protein